MKEGCAGARCGWAVDADAVAQVVGSHVRGARVVEVRAGMRGSIQHHNVCCADIYLGIRLIRSAAQNKAAERTGSRQFHPQFQAQDVEGWQLFGGSSNDILPVYLLF